MTTGRFLVTCQYYAVAIPAACAVPPDPDPPPKLPQHFFGDELSLHDITDEYDWNLFSAVTNGFSRDLMERLIQNGNLGNVDSTSSSLMSELLTGALLYGITWWLNHKQQLTKDELTKRLSDFIINVIDGEK